MKRKKQSDTALLAEAISKLADALSAIAAKTPPIVSIYQNPPLTDPNPFRQPYATWGGTGGTSSFAAAGGYGAANG